MAEIKTLHDALVDELRDLYKQSDLEELFFALVS